MSFKKKSKKKYFEFFVMMGHDAARRGSVPHSAEHCRAAPSPIQNNNKNKKSVSFHDLDKK